MIRVLQIGMTYAVGGIETYLMNYYRNIDRDKVQFDFINIYDKEIYFKKEIEELGGKIYKVSNYYKHPIRYTKELIKIINENNYEVIHCNMNSAVYLWPLIAAKLSNAKTIISHSHNSSSDKGWLKALLHNVNKIFIPCFANKYFACSNKAGAWFFSKKHLESKDYYVINNAIELGEFAYDEKSRIKMRQELGIEDNIFVLGHIGRFKKQKNHEFLIDIFYEYQKTNNNSLLMLVGVGPLEQKIKEKVKNLKIEDKVWFLGRRNDAAQLYQAMDFFLLPSLYEGLPLVGVEAQVCGLNCLFSENITEEVLINEKSMRLPLISAKEWSENIKKSNDREINFDSFKNFQIKKEAKRLLEIYIQ